MIYGVGIDIVEVERVRRVLCRHPSRFPAKVLHPRERALYDGQRDPAAFLARQFALKEAVAKALGRGFARGLHPSRILVGRDGAGRPYAVLPPGFDAHTVAVSVSAERRYAVAHATAFDAAGAG